MSEKTEIIVSVLLDQAGKQKEVAAKSFRDSLEHKGAEEALTLLAQKILDMSVGIEKDLREGTEFEGDTGTRVLKFAKGLIAQMARLASDNAKNQGKQAVLAEGRSDQAHVTSELLEKDAANKRAFAANREALDAEREREAAKKPKKPKKKAATERKASAKRKAASKKPAK